MELEKKINSIDKRLAIIESNPLLVALNNMNIKLAAMIVDDFERQHIKGNPLTLYEVRRRKDLTDKLEAKTITPDEAKELNNILKKELEEARNANNFLAFLGILFLLGLLVAIMSGD
jgi:hypothetical protein